MATDNKRRPRAICYFSRPLFSYIVCSRFPKNDRHDSGETMPHTSSAKKRLRQNEKRRAHNRAAKSAIKTELKKVLATAKTGTVDQLREEVKIAAKKLDKAAAKRIVHPNLAARKKSQIAKLLHSKTTAGQPAG